MKPYAANTTVSESTSRTEIEHILDRYGATDFAFAKNAAKAMIVFQANGRRVRFNVPFPTEEQCVMTPEGRTRHKASNVKNAQEQETRRRWRALALAIKAKLEVVQSGISTFEEEFLAHIVVPGQEDMTMGEYLVPKLEEAYRKRQLPALLPSMEK